MFPFHRPLPSCVCRTSSFCASQQLQYSQNPILIILSIKIIQNLVLLRLKYRKNLKEQWKHLRNKWSNVLIISKLISYFSWEYPKFWLKTKLNFSTVDLIQRVKLNQVRFSSKVCIQKSHKVDVKLGNAFIEHNISKSFIALSTKTSQIWNMIIINRNLARLGWLACWLILTGRIQVGPPETAIQWLIVRIWMVSAMIWLLRKQDT